MLGVNVNMQWIYFFQVNSVASANTVWLFWVCFFPPQIYLHLMSLGINLPLWSRTEVFLGLLLSIKNQQSSIKKASLQCFLNITFFFLIQGKKTNKNPSALVFLSIYFPPPKSSIGVHAIIFLGFVGFLLLLVKKDKSGTNSVMEKEVPTSLQVKHKGSVISRPSKKRKICKWQRST